MPALTLDQVKHAARRLDGRVHRTPVLTSRSLDEAVGHTVFLKCENLQRAGAFKIRGALNKLLSLSPEERRRGVVAFSSGNHAQGVALAARMTGTSALILMPTDAPALKLLATRGYGAEVVFYDRQTEDREQRARELVEKTGRVLVPPYDDYAIMAGQGTAALELLGVEADSANDTWLSLRKGERVSIAPPPTIADGIRNLSPGALTFPILRRNLTDVLLVADEEIKDAVRFLLLRGKTLVEPTGAVPVAALRAGKLPLPKGARVGVILSGGNVDPETLADLLTHKKREADSEIS